MNKEYERKVETKRVLKQRQEDEKIEVKKSENRYLTTLFRSVDPLRLVGPYYARKPNQVC